MLEAAGGSVLEGGVKALGVVVAVDEGEDFTAGIGSVDEAAVLQHLCFERAHERLGPGVVIGIGSSGHALAHPREPQDVAEGSAAVLAASVAVEDQINGVASGGDGLLHGFDDQIAAQMIGQGPTNDASGAQVDDDGEIEPFFTTGDERDVSGPHFVGSAWQGLIEEQVG